MKKKKKKREIVFKAKLSFNVSMERNKRKNSWLGNPSCLRSLPSRKDNYNKGKMKRNIGD